MKPTPVELALELKNDFDKENKRMKHTKGPWKIETSENKVGPYTSSCWEIWNQNTHVCDINEHVDNPLIDQANAHLIAAAPDLLEASKQLLEIIKNAKRYKPEQYEDACVDLEQAIAKAEGK